MENNNLLNLEPFSLNKIEKQAFFLREIKKLTKFHYKNSKEYKNIIDFLNFDLKEINLAKLPFLPAGLFKKHKLVSVPQNKIIKVLHSSGTSGNLNSKIYLDKDNAYLQMKVLTKIFSSTIGEERLPMLIIDKNQNKVENGEMLSAKSAAINGFSLFGKEHTFLLDADGNINYKILNQFLERNSNKSFLIFGFTSLVYENLFEKLNLNSIFNNFENGILIHGGGWKKMENKKVRNKDFKNLLKEKISLKKIYNYYGLVEQTGSIFFECKKCSCFRTSVFSELLIRDKDFNIAKKGEKGFIQLLSLLPRSYPGHNILTEDIGEIIQDNSCECEKFGTRFIVHGRSKKSEIRGCSDI
jgi:phenylacetate-coenzyme A ligase PaaK-like adenylate-forming protein